MCLGSKTFLLFLSPPVKPIIIVPRDIIFILDRSGSMYGKPWADAKSALATALHNLHVVCLMFLMLVFDVFDASFDVYDVCFDVYDACFDVFDACLG